MLHRVVFVVTHHSTRISFFIFNSLDNLEHTSQEYPNLEHTIEQCGAKPSFDQFNAREATRQNRTTAQKKKALSKEEERRRSNKLSAAWMKRKYNHETKEQKKAYRQKRNEELKKDTKKHEAAKKRRAAHERERRMWQRTVQPLHNFQYPNKVDSLPKLWRDRPKHLVFGKMTKKYPTPDRMQSLYQDINIERESLGALGSTYQTISTPDIIRIFHLVLDMVPQKNRKDALKMVTIDMGSGLCNILLNVSQSVLQQGLHLGIENQIALYDTASMNIKEVMVKALRNVMKSYFDAEVVEQNGELQHVSPPRVINTRADIAQLNGVPADVAFSFDAVCGPEFHKTKATLFNKSPWCKFIITNLPPQKMIEFGFQDIDLEGRRQHSAKMPRTVHLKQSFEFYIYRRKHVKDWSFGRVEEFENILLEGPFQESWKRYKSGEKNLQYTFLSADGKEVRSKYPINMELVTMNLEYKGHSSINPESRSSRGRKRTWDEVSGLSTYK